MINLNKLPHSVTAAIGALFVSTAFIAAAVGPAHAVGAAPQAIAQVQSSAQAHA